jgi:hypothetical protein
VFLLVGPRFFQVGRSSLSEKEVAFRARRDEEMMRSMVNDFLDDGLILVPRSFWDHSCIWVVGYYGADGFARVVVGIASDSHQLCWVLKSPAIMKGSEGVN